MPFNHYFKTTYNNENGNAVFRYYTGTDIGNDINNEYILSTIPVV